MGEGLLRRGGRLVGGVRQCDAFCTLVIALEGVHGLVTGRGRVVGSTTDKASEEGCDHRLSDDDFVVSRPPFEMEELDADGLGLEDGLEVVGVDTVLGDKALENVKALWGELVDTAVLEEVGGRVGRVFDKPCIHEMLAHRLGHIAGHREGRCCRSRDDSRGFSWVRPTI